MYNAFNPFSEDFSPNIFWFRKIILWLFRDFFLSRIFLCVDFFLYQSEILSGIQKSYLENRATILNPFEIQNAI